MIVQVEDKKKEKKSAKAHQKPFFFLFLEMNELEMGKLKCIIV